jgi:hypothetical protein
MKKTLSLLALTALLGCDNGLQPRPYTLPSGQQVKTLAFHSNDSPGHIKLETKENTSHRSCRKDCDSTALMYARGEITGTVTYIGSLKRSSDLTSLTQVAVGGSGVLAGGAAINNAPLEEQLVIMMRPNDARLPEYVLNVRPVPGPNGGHQYKGISPRVLLDTVKEGSRIAVIPFRQLSYGGSILLNPTDVYSPENIRIIKR